MALSRQTVEFPFNKLDTYNDPERLELGSFVSGTNIEYSTPNVIRPRRSAVSASNLIVSQSNTYRSTTSQITDAKALFDAGDATAVIANNALSLWSDTLGNFRHMGPLSPLVVSRDLVASTNETRWSQTSCRGGDGLDYYACVYPGVDYDGDGAHNKVQVVVKDGDKTVATNTFAKQLQSATSVDLMQTTSGAIALSSYYDNAGTGYNRVYSDTMTTGSFALSASVVNTYQNKYGFTARESMNSNHAVFAYKDSLSYRWHVVSGTKNSVMYHTVVLWDNEVATTTDHVSASLFVDTTNKRVFLSTFDPSTYAVYVNVFDMTGSVVSSNNRVWVPLANNYTGHVMSGSGNTLYLVANIMSPYISQQLTYMNKLTWTGTTLTSSSTGTYPTGQLLWATGQFVSEPYNVLGRNCVSIRDYSTDYPSINVLDLDSGDWLARYSLGTAGQSINERPGSTTFIRSSSVTHAYLSRHAQLSDNFDRNSLSFTPTWINDVNSLTIGSQSDVPVVKVNDSVLLGTAVPMSYDSLSLTEHGFTRNPEIISSTFDHTGTGPLTPGNVHAYQFTYSWDDNSGKQHVSAPSKLQYFTVPAGTDEALFYVSNLVATKKRNVKIQGYRSLANPSVTDENTLVLYRFTPIDSQTGYTVLGSYTAIYDDSQTDADIQDNQVIYTSGGEVENEPCPAFSAGCAALNRAFIVPREADTTIWYSKEVTDVKPLEFSSLLTINTDSRTGKINALAQLTDKVLVFKDSCVYYVFGDGYDNRATGTNFVCTLLTTQFGVTDVSSVVELPQGVAFKSTLGYKLVTPDLQVQDIGQDIMGTDTEDVLSSCVDTVNQRSLWSTATKTLVWDWSSTPKWTTWSLSGSVGMVARDGNLDGITASGYHWQVTPQSTRDDLNVVTGWLSFAGIQGFKRVWYVELLAQHEKKGTVTLSVAYDGDSTVKQTRAFSLASCDSPALLKMTLQRQLCRSLQLTVSTSGCGDIALKSLQFDCGMEQGNARTKHKL